MTAGKVTEPNVPTLLDVLEKLGAKTLEVEHLRAINAELRAALREMVECYGSDDGCGPILVIERARAAIAKAQP